jgi:hypothetical protein
MCLQERSGQLPASTPTCSLLAWHRAEVAAHRVPAQCRCMHFRQPQPLLTEAWEAAAWFCCLWGNPCGLAAGGLRARAMSCLAAGQRSIAAHCGRGGLHLRRLGKDGYHRGSPAKCRCPAHVTLWRGRMTESVQCHGCIGDHDRQAFMTTKERRGWLSRQQIGIRPHRTAGQ